jgi:thiosulfate/3-mercaptopyruvate sulfurtransferase
MAANREALVATEWVAEHGNDPGVVIAEVDEDATAYHTGHIPGAVGFDWKADFQDPLRRTFLNKEGFEQLVASRGISNDTHVVLYGGNSNWFAAYAYWYFKIYGHERVSLVDGGRKKWELEGRPLTDEPTTIEQPGSYTASEPNTAIRARRDEILQRYVGSPEGTALVDVRSPAEFSGEIVAPPSFPQETAQVPGHIPGAKNISWGRAVNADTGEFLPIEQLRELYTAQGVSGDRDIVAYCRIGERSAHSWFVLHELLGYDRVRNYDGSWTEYGSLIDVPVERGAAG